MLISEIFQLRATQPRALHLYFHSSALATKPFEFLLFIATLSCFQKLILRKAWLDT